MLKRFASTLILLSGFLMVLPPGWCCMAARIAVCQAPAEAKKGCCGQKCPEQPASPKKQVPIDYPCCVDHHTILPEFSSVKQLGLGFPPVVVLLVLRTIPCADGKTFAAPAFPLTFQIHISKCVWLC
jgi:hypothetical protein